MRADRKRTKCERTGSSFAQWKILAAVIAPSYHVHMSRHMDARKSQGAFAALAQPTRLKAFRRLVAAHPQGLPAGEIAAFCKVPHNTMSTHLAILTRAGLIAARRDGRMVHYSADIDGFRAMVAFLMRDCCGDRAEICAPLLAELTCCVPSRKREKARA